MHNLQDMLYQYKESTNVDLLVGSSEQIRTLTLELSTKSKLIDQLKEELKKVIGTKPSDLKRDEDLAGYLANIIKNKDVEIQSKDMEVKQLMKREGELKDMMQKYEVLSNATQIVESRDERSVHKMTADFRRNSTNNVS